VNKQNVPESTPVVNPNASDVALDRLHTAQQMIKRLDRLLAQTEDVALLKEMDRRTSKRLDVVTKQIQMKEGIRLWGLLTTGIKEGDRVYSLAGWSTLTFGTASGFEVKVGDPFIVWRIQPKVQRLWVLPEGTPLPKTQQEVRRLDESQRLQLVTPARLGERIIVSRFSRTAPELTGGAL
jgi:hypothetical protein